MSGQTIFYQVSRSKVERTKALFEYFNLPFDAEPPAAKRF
jgi:hypothetical protein